MKKIIASIFTTLLLACHYDASKIESVHPSSDKQADEIWNVKPTILTGPNHAVFSVAFSPNSHTFAAVCLDDNTIYLFKNYRGTWNKTPTQTLNPTNSYRVHSVVFSTDGNTLAAVAGYSIYLYTYSNETWSLAPTQTLNPINSNDFVRSVAFSPDGNTLAVRFASSENPQISSVYLFSKSGETWGKTATQILTINQTRTDTGDLKDLLTFSPDGTSLAVKVVNEIYFFTKSRRLWGAAATQILNLTASNATQYSGHAVNAMTFSTDGNILAVSFLDDANKIQLFTKQHGNWSQIPKKILMLSDRNQAVKSLMFSPDGTTLAIASWNQVMTGTIHKIYLFNHSQGDWKQATAALKDTSSDWLYSLAFSPDGKTLAAGAYEKIYVYNKVSRGSSN